jgi:antitoxin MazE
MQVARWGNSLAIRIPAELVRRMDWKEGDPVHFLIDDDGTVRLLDRKAMDAYLDRLSVPLPAGWKFSREELYEEELERRFPTIGDAAA